MLSFLRGHGTKWLVKLVLWTLVLAFVGTMGLVWGYGHERNERPVAKVGAYSITHGEYRRHYGNMLRRLQEMAGASLTQDMIKQMHLDRSALDGLIMEKLQLKAAKDAGMVVTDEELRHDIEITSAFQRDGHFDRDTYNGALRGANLSPREYEKVLKQDLMIRKVAQIVTDSVQTTDQEVLDAYIRENEGIGARYFAVTPIEFTADALRNADKELGTYFTANASRYAKPEQRTVQLIHADIAPGKDEGGAKKKLFAILNDTTGKDLKTQAGDNGFRFEELTPAAGQMVTGNPDATMLLSRIFSAKEGELAGPVQLSKSLCIFKVTKIIPAHPSKLEEVRKDVEAAYVKEESMRRAADAAAKAVERINKGEDFAAVAGKVKVVSAKPFKRGDSVEGLAAGAVNAAFGLKEKAAARIPADNGFIVLQVVARIQPAMADFGDKRVKIREDLLARKRQEAIMSWQNALHDDATKQGLIKIEEKEL